MNTENSSVKTQRNSWHRWSLLLLMLSVMGAIPQISMVAHGQEQATVLKEARAQIHLEGSGDWMREKFSRDLEPIALTPGGAGTLVVLYSKKAGLSMPVCTGFDLVMGAKKGRVIAGWECDANRCKD